MVSLGRGKSAWRWSRAFQGQGSAGSIRGRMQNNGWPMKVHRNRLRASGRRMASAEQDPVAWQRMSENATDGRRCRCIQKWLAKEWLLARRRAAFWVQKKCTQNPRKSFEREHMTSGTRAGGVFVCRKMHENPVVCRICAWPVVFHPDNPPGVTGWA